MNIVYDPKLKSALCPKCRDKAKSNNNGDLECMNPDCKYIYYMFSDKDNSFQKELFE